MTGDPFFLLQPQHFLDIVLQAFADFLARSVHWQRGDLGAQVYRQVAALARFERAAPLFEPSFELGAGHTPIVRQTCCIINTTVASRGLVARLVARRLVGVEVLGEAPLVSR